MPPARLVAVLLAAGGVAGRALQAASVIDELHGQGEDADLAQFTFSTAAWLKDVQKINATKENATEPKVVGSVAGASACTSVRIGAADAWCDRNCINTPASSFCTLSCHCPGWNAKPKVTKTKTAKEDVACISKDYQLSTDNWCNDNCVGYEGDGGESHDKECEDTCECTAKLKALADARMSKAEAEVAKAEAKVAKAEAAASPAPLAKGVCKSISEEAPAAWCDKNCQADPNAQWCEKACRCPGFSVAKVKKMCTSVSESTPASWCQETCVDTPDTKQCAMMCHCPGWKAANVQPLRAPPKPAAADPAPQPKQAPTPKDVQAPGPQPVQAPAPQPVQQSMKPQTFDKVCKRKIGSSVSADWCDRSCASTPNSDECKSVCDCPSLSAKPAKVEKAVKAKCVSSNDLGLGDIEAAAQWCDQNCMNDPGAQWCRPCKCPKMSAL